MNLGSVLNVQHNLAYSSGSAIIYIILLYQRFLNCNVHWDHQGALRLQIAKPRLQHFCFRRYRNLHFHKSPGDADATGWGEIWEFLLPDNIQTLRKISPCLFISSYSFKSLGRDIWYYNIQHIIIKFYYYNLWKYVYIWVNSEYNIYMFQVFDMLIYLYINK